MRRNRNRSMKVWDLGGRGNATVGVRYGHFRYGHFRSAGLLLAAIVAAVSFGATRSASGQTTLYWDPTTGTSTYNWDSTDAFWNAALGGTVGTDTTWSSGDIADFSATQYPDTPFTANLTIGTTAAGLIFNSGAGTITASGSGVNGLTLGASGILINSTAGPTALDATLGNITLSASQSWTNNIASSTTPSLTVNAGVSAGADTLTLSGTGNTLFGGAINATTGALVVNSTVTLGSGATFTSGSSTGEGIFLGGNGTTDGTGTLVVTGSSPTAVSDGGIFRLGIAGASGTSNGALYLSPAMGATGVVSIANNLNIGWTSNASGTANGTVYQSGGTLDLTSTSSTLYIGLSTTSGGVGHGTYNIDAGTTIASAASPVYLASTNGSGTAFTSSVTGTLNVSGTGVFNTVAASVFEVNEGNDSGFQATVNLNSFNGNSGTFYSAAWTAGTQTNGVLNFNGGTLKFGATGSTSFLGTGIGTVNLYVNGGIINTNGDSNTITQAIGNAASFGVTSATATDTADTFTTPPAVTFTGGSGGTAATGYAQLNAAGQIDGIVVTNGGTQTTAPTGLSIAGATNVSGITDDTAANNTGGLTVYGGGTLTLSAASTYSGTTTVNGATLSLSATGTGSSPLSLISGTLTSSVNQNLGGLTLTGGSSTVNDTVSTTTLALGGLAGIARNVGATVAFNAVASPGTITYADNANNGMTNGIVGPWATFGAGTSMQYATTTTSSPGPYVLSGLTGTTAASAAAFTDPTANYEYSLSGGTDSSIAGPAAANTIHFTGAGGETIALAGNTLTLGGILNASSGNLAITSTSGGGITIGGSQELVLLGQGSGSSMNISAPIGDSLGGPSALTVGLTGSTLTLGGANTYSGGTFLDAGTLSVSAISDTGTSNIGPSSGATNNTLTFAGGSLQYTGAGSASTGRNISLLSASTVVVSGGAGSNLTLSGTISNPAGNLGVYQGATLTLGTGTTGSLTLSGNNTYASGTTLAAGTLNINASGTNSTNSAIGTGTLTIGNGTTINNTSGSPVTLATNNAEIWNGSGTAGSFTYGGSGSLNLGTGNVTITGDGATAYTQTVNVNAATPGTTLTLGGAIALASTVTVATDTLAFNGPGAVTIAGSIGATGQSLTTAVGLNASGTMVVTSNSPGAISWGGDAMRVGEATSATSSGILYLAPGMGTTGVVAGGAGDITIGWNVTAAETITGTVYQSAGTLETTGTGHIYIGIASVASGNVTGTYDIDGGLLAITGTGAVWVAANGASGNNTVKGTLNVSGTGLVNTTANASGFETEEGTGSSAFSSTVNLNSFNGNSGTLYTQAWVTGASATAVLNFNGGTLKFGSTGSTNFLATSTASVNLYANGGIINTNGETDTITQVIGNPNGSGVESVTFSGASNTYLTPPTVTFFGGAGTAATGYAQLNSAGQIAGIIVTNGGNYSNTAGVTASIAGQSGTFTINTAANNTSGLSVTGGGTLKLSAANTFSGPTTVAAGTTLDLTNALALQNSTLANGGITFDSSVVANAFTLGGLSGSGNLSLLNTASTPITLSVGNNNSSTVYSGALSGALGNLTKIGTGTLTLSGNSNYTGTTTISAGTLSLTGAISGAGGLALSGVTFSYAPTANAGSGNTQSFSGLTDNAGNSIVNVTSGNTLALGALSARSTGGTIAFDSSTSGTITTSASNTNGLMGNGGGWATIGSGTSLQYAVASATAVSGLTYSGTSTSVSGLTLFSDGSALPNYTISGGGGTLTAPLSAGTIQFTGTAPAAIIASAANPLTVNGLMNDASAAVTIAGGNLNAGSTSELVFTGPGNFNVLSAIGNNGSNASALTMSGSGTLTLGGANTYTGPTYINAGVVSIGAVGNLGAASVSGNELVAVNGGTLQATGSFSLISSASGTPALAVSLGAAGGTIDVTAGNTLTVNGLIGGIGSLTKTDTGALVFDSTTASNTFSGGLTIQAGTVVNESNNGLNALGTGPVALQAAAGATATLNFNGVNANNFATFANAINISGSGTNTISASSWNPIFSGAVTLNNANLTIGSNNNNGSNLNFSGGITGTGNVTVSINDNAGTGSASNLVAIGGPGLTINGTITYNNAAYTGSNIYGGSSDTGTNTITTVGSGVTAITEASISNPLSITGLITVGSSGITLASNGTAQFTASGGVGGIGNLTLSNNSATGNGTTTGGIALTTAAVNNVGTITNSGTGSGSVLISAPINSNVTGVTQNSPTSTLILTGTNTYAGPTTVSAGTLYASGAATIPAATTLNVSPGGTFSLNNGVGTTTVAGLNLTGGTLGLNWTGTNSETIATSAAATTSGNVGIVLTLSSPSGNPTLLSSANGGLGSATYYLADNTAYTATLTPSANSLTIGSYTTASALTSAYWQGGELGGTAGNVMAYSTGALSNWSSGGPSYTASALVPGSSTAVTFSTTSPANSSVVLGANMSVASLTFNTPITIAADGNALTVAGAAGITTNASTTIAAPIIDSVGQTWTTASGQQLTIGGAITGSGGVTLLGSGTVAIGDPSGMLASGISVNSGNLVFNGTAPIVAAPVGGINVGFNNNNANPVLYIAPNVTGALNIGSSANSFLVGYTSGSQTVSSNGTVYQEGGAVNVPYGGQFYIGISQTSGKTGTGIYDMSGGSALAGNSFYLGGYSTTGTGTIGVGTLNMNGGTFTAAGTVGIGLNTGACTVNLNGGTLQTPAWTTTGTTTTLNFNGGTFVASAASGAIFGAETSSVNIYAGGATIAPNGNAVTITQALTNPTNNAATTVTVSGAPTLTYATPGAVPLAPFSVGGGTAPQGYAYLTYSNTLSGYIISGIEITNGGQFTGTATLASPDPGLTFTVNNSGAGTANSGGGLTVGGSSGTLTLAGSGSNYAGPTTIDTGTTLAFGETGAGTITLAGNIGGGGQLKQTGSGTTTLSGTNSYGGPTTISAGILDFVNEASLYGGNTAQWTTSNIIVTSGATLGLRVGNSSPQFTTSDLSTLLGLATATGGFESGASIGLDTTSGNLTYSTPIANTNGGANVLGLNKLGTNTLILPVAETYTGATTVTAGTLQLGNGTTANGSVVGNIVNNSTLEFNNPFAQTYSGTISGTGNIVFAGPGTFTFSGTTTNGIIDSGTATGDFLVLNSTAASVLAGNSGGAQIRVGTSAIATAYITPAVVGIINPTTDVTVGWSPTGGANSSGTVYQAGGTVVQSATAHGFYLGVTQASGLTSTSVYSMSGGLLQIPSGNTFYIASSNVSGGTSVGTLNINNASVLVQGTFTTTTTGTSSSTINLNSGGLLETNALSAGMTALNFNGGMLEPLAGSANFLSGTGSVKIYAGGANINTNGLAITIGQALTNPANSEISSIGATPTGDVFATPPTVTFTGGTGSGASGYAVLNAAGNIVGIDITNGGSYTVAPSASIAGYNGTLTVGSLVANSAGGLTVTGGAGGVLTLTGTNTYSGPTTLTSGVLELTTNASSLSSASNLVFNGGQLGLGGAATATFGNSLGTGAGQVQFAASGGFVGYVSGATVNLGGGTSVQWGSGSFVPTGSSLILGAANDTFTVTVANPIDFNGSQRTVQALRGAASGADAALSGALTDSQNSNGGLNLIGGGILSLAGANTYGGGTTVSGNSTLIATETSGTPLGTGPITLAGGTLGIAPSGSGSAVSLSGANATTSTTLSYGPAAGAIALNNGGNTSVSFTAGGSAATLTRNGAGTLVIAPSDPTAGNAEADLGVSQQLFLGSGTPPVTNGIANTSIIVQNNDAYQSGDFATYTANGFQGASVVGGIYSANTNINTALPTDVFLAASSGTNTLSGAAAVYALNTNGQTITATGQTLTVGNNSGQAGLILNGGTISGGTLAFGAAEGTIYTSKVGGQITAAITGSGGITSFGPGTLSLASTSNTYSGPTAVNSGTLQLGLQVVSNGGFATIPAIGSGYGYDNSSPQLSTAQISSLGWTTTSNFAVAGNGSAFNVAASPSGQAAVLQTNATPEEIQESVYFPVAGTYTLSLYDEFRTGTTAGPFTAALSTNGTIGSFTPTSATTFGHATATIVVAAPGSQTLSFTGGTAPTSFVTDVAIYPATTTGQLPASTPLSVASGATFDLGGNSQTIQSLSGAGTVTDGLYTGTVPTLTIAPLASTSTTFSGVIQSGEAAALAVTLNGSSTGTQIFTGANTYTGTTTLTSGTLQLGDGATSNGSVAGSIVDNAALVIANPSAQTFANAVSGGGTLRVSGPGTLAITNANTFSGGATLSAGTLVLGLSSTGNPGSVTNGPVGTGTLTLSGGTIEDNSTAITLANAVSLGGNTTFASAAITTLNGVVTTTGTGNGNLTFSGATAFATGSSTPILTVNNTTTFSGTITGGGSNAITKAGSGTLVLSGSGNTYGSTTINAGILEFGSDGSIPTGTGNVTINNGATMAAGSAIDQTFLNHITSGSTGVAALAVNSSNPLDFSSVGANLAGISLGAITSATFSGTLTPNGTTYYLGGGGGNLTVSSTLSGGNAVLIGNTGTGSVVLSGNNSFTGGVTIDGTLILGSTGALNSSTPNAITFNGGTNTTVLGLAGNSASVGNLTVSSGTPIIENAAGTSVANATLTVANTAPATFSGTLEDGSGGGTLALAVAGNSTLALTGANTYSGGTYLNSGTLSITADSQLGTAPSSPATNITFNGGGLEFNASGITLNANRSILINSGGATFNTGGNNATFSGGISGGGGLNVTGGGVFTLASANTTYTGPTTVASGTLKLALASAPAFLNPNFASPVQTGGANAYTYFNNPSLGGYGPGSPVEWNTTAPPAAIVQANASAWNFSTIPSAAGTQSGVIQGVGNLYQTLDFTVPGSYTISFLAETRPSQPGTVAYFQLNGANVGSSFSPPNNSWYSTGTTPYTETFTIPTPGNYTVGFSQTVGAAAVGITGVTLGFTTPPSNPSLATSSLVQLTSPSSVLDATSTISAIGPLSGVAGSLVTIPGATLTITSATTSTFAGSITGASGNLILTGGGTQILSGSGNTYNGTTTINGGTLKAGAANAFSPNSAVTINSGALDATGGVQTIPALSMDSSATLNVAIGDLLTITTSATLDGTLNLSGSGTNGEELIALPTGYTGSFTTVNAPFGDSVSYTSTQVDLVVTITSANWIGASGSWQTPTNWSTGAVPNASGFGALFTQSNSTTETITLDGAVTVGALTFGTGSSGQTNYILSAGSGGMLMLNNATNSAPASIAVLGGSHSITAPLEIAGGNLGVAISGGGTLSISGPISDDNGTRSLTLTSGDSSGVLVLGNGSNTYGGGTTISSGALRLGASNALPSGGAVSVGGKLDLAGWSQANPIGALSGSGTIASSGSATLSTLTVGGGGSFSGTIADNFGTNNGQTVALAVSGGTLALGGSDSYSGGTSISGGTLRLGSSGALPSGGAVALSGSGSLDLGGQSPTVGMLNGASGTIASSGGSSTLTVGGGGSFSGTIANNFGSGVQTVALAVSGNTLTLGGANTYSGGTQVTGGTLVVANSSGSATGSGTVAVGSGATIAGSGSGTIGNGASLLSVQSGGIVAPSLSFGLGSATKLNVNGNVTLASGTVLDFYLSGSPDGTISPNGFNDYVAITGTGNGNLTLSGGGTLNITGSPTAGTYELFTYTGTGSGSVTGWSVTGQPNDTFSFGDHQFDVIIPTASGSATWASTSGSSDASWGDPSNWTPAVGSTPVYPDGIGQVATFDAATATQANVKMGGGNYTISQLIFNNASGTNYTIGSDGTGTLTFNNGGSGSIVIMTGGATATINSNLSLAEPSPNLSTTFNIGSGSTLNAEGVISEAVTGETITLTGGGTLYLDGMNIYTGGTTVNGGTLNVGYTSGSGALGTGPLTINAVGTNVSSMVNLYNGPTTIYNLSGTVSGGGSTATLTVESSAQVTLVQSASGSYAGTINVGTAGTLAINVNAGTLALANTAAQNISGTVSATVAAGATLQLAGTASALSNSDGSYAAAIANHGTLSVTGTNQTVGVVTGVASVTGPTTYDGDTVVGNGSAAANLTATQILQNSLTINAGSTVTIAPAGDPPAAIPAASSAVAATPARSVSEGDAADSDPFTAIQNAIASGAISSTTGQVLENRMAAIERLAAVDPGLDASLLESRVLAVLPSSTTLSAAADSSPIIDGGSSLLALDSSSLGSGSATSAAFAPSAGFAGSPAAVPEPTSFALACLAAIGLAFALRRRVAGGDQRTGIGLAVAANMPGA